VRFGWPLRALGAELWWNEAWDLTFELLRDPWSHLNASLANFRYVPSPVDAAFFNWVDAYQVMNRGKGKVRPPALPRPWAPTGAAPDATRARVVDPERAERRARLADRLGLARS